MATVADRPQMNSSFQERVDHLLSVVAAEWEVLPETLAMLEMEEADEPDMVATWLITSSELASRVIELRRWAEGGEMTRPQLAAFLAVDRLISEREPMFQTFLRDRGMTLQIFPFIPYRRE